MHLSSEYFPLTIFIRKKVNINNINAVSEVEMDYSMDIFFRQFWTDRRLSFEGANELVIGADFLKVSS